LSAFGIEIISDQNNGSAIKQPCASHKNHLCSIYADRPRSCRAFQCKLLKRVTANETSEAEALAIIRQAVAYRDRVRQVMSRVFGGNACTFDDFTLRLRANWKNAASFEEKERVSELFSAFAQLWWNINKYFHDRWLR
jgi:Fe-S-cluster containining protein